ncbi:MULTISPECIES: site-specific integrase [Aeromonas]|uniref:site-specific integrase n=1 Tax=Aeromonas TaxID=642 RepID=UPI000332BC83|nr:site-specific integrase [Aeromonas hydrophila]QHB82403.1 tyrosine-type recombinase/integrase [Aeromonas veronii]AGM44307.1 phage integrase family site specific recombinase [Aeromonas hydrophila ML09-119]AHX32976.1 integrase [Aeromonas hydrophila subsp. hydrophila AL09-71]AHX69775.1 integrase [Aeromonas hydrophila pc104A]AKJ34445.1 integrase [Aeromonas hydrophila NJ-35]
MNLWLSPHGIWYYRKVTTLPCGRRKEIKKSLHTRDKLTARAAVAKLLACVRSRPKPIQLPADVNAAPHEQSVAQPMTPATKPRAPYLSVLSDRYQKEKALSWAPKERKNQKNYLGSFIEAIGDKPAAGYSKADVVKFKEGLLNSGKSPATINKYLQKLSLLFSWLANHQEGFVNHFAGLKLQRVKEVNSRSGYTAEERRKFIGWTKQQEPHRRWIALLGLFTGARANEICQLYADDVQQVDGIWCLNIRSGRPDQKLKTANSARLVPLHRHLLQNGFIEFVKGRIGGRLFPELPHRQDGYSHLWGQWFSRHRPVDKDFHSLRHTVGTALKDHGVPLQYAAAILGHTNGAISYDRYGGDVSLDKLHEVIEAALSSFADAG